MKKYFLLVVTCLVGIGSFAQLANVNYSVRINRLVHLEFGCGNCWESGDEEYTGFGRFRDNVNTSITSSPCQTCTENGNCTYAQNIVIGSRTNASYDLTIFTDGWENDRDDRCTYDSDNNIFTNDDDCRTNVNATFQFRELAFPSNTYNITELSVGNCDMTGYYDVTWRYSGTSTLSPACTQGNIAVTAGKIASVAFQLTAGRTYQFGTCEATEDTHLRIYGTDGYTIVALNDDNGPMCNTNRASLNFTPTTTGTYYVEIARYNRARLQTNFNLTHQDITVNTGITTTLAGGGNYCFGNNVTLVATTNAPIGSTFSWYSGSCEGTLLSTTSTNSYSFVATTPGTTDYFVRVNVPDNCTPLDCQTVTVILPTLGTELSNDNESSSCVVNGTNFIEFRHPSGRLIAAVNPNNQNLGAVTATSYVQTSPINIEACNSSSYVSAALGRRWVIRPTNQPATPVRVRLYFNNLEYQSLQTEANANTNLDDNTLVFGDLYLTKYRNDGSTTVNNVFTDNCASGTVSIWSPQTNGNITALQPGFDANGRYIEYTISDFSEFWLHGSRNISPLPVVLQNFKAICSDKKQVISWTSMSEINCSHYMVDRSRDGQSWTNIGTVEGNGNSQTPQNYTFEDPIKSYETTYYRLNQIDFDGKNTVLDISSLDCEEKHQFAVYPNPSKGDFTVSYVSVEGNIPANLVVKDLAGRTIFTQAVQIDKGINNLYIIGREFKVGTYLVYLIGVKNEPTPFKLQID